MEVFHRRWKISEYYIRRVSQLSWWSLCDITVRCYLSMLI